MNKTMRIFAVIILILGLLLGIAVTAYPVVSAWYSESVRSEIHTRYEEQISVLDTSVLDKARTAAEAYNARFFAEELDPLKPAENGYYDLLKVTDNDAMGYIHIPKIRVNLPIYHGIGDDALERGCGHLPQSTLPVGGINTHAVISAHSGMASSPMFSDLGLLCEGDTFQLDILGETLTYEVDQIKTVLPVDISSIRIESGKDLVTLVTCTPYGVNTHRLLVRGHRIENPSEETITATVQAEESAVDESMWLTEYYRRVMKGSCMAGLVIVCTITAVVIRRKRYG